MKTLRAVVSGSRVRYMQNGFDLDLTYITPSLIAMGYPASGVEKTYRNDINEVATLLDSHHPNAYRVFNLSERKYDYAKFGNRVTECGFPDHHPPPLQTLLDIMNEMLEWTGRSSRHVAVVHCLAGKGRTGVVCSCFLLLTGYYGNVFKLRKERDVHDMANHAIRDFWTARGQGVRFPSQALYIYYFIKVLRRLGRTPTRIPPLLPAKRMLLKSVTLYGIPDFEAPPRGGCTPFLQVLPAPSQYEKPNLLYNSSWQRPVFETYVPDDQGTIVFQVNCVIQGDILVRCFHANTFTMVGKHVAQIFHFTFNTDFFHKNSDLYRLPKAEIDEATGNDRFPPTFHVDCHVEMINDESVVPIAQKPTQEIINPAEAPVMPQAVKMESEPARARAESAPVPMQPMMGWLYKQGGFVKNWKKRWFVAREGKLMYFYGASDPTPLGVVDLRRVTVDVCTPEEINARNHCLHYFKVMPLRRDQRTYYFGADTEQDMIKWIHMLAVQSCYGLKAETTARHSTYGGGISMAEARTKSYTSIQDRFSDSRVVYGSGRGQAPITGFALATPVPAASRYKDPSITRLGRATSTTEVLPSSAAAATAASSRASYPMERKNSILEDDDRFLWARDVKPSVPSTPMDLSHTLSAEERATVLQEFENFRGDIYIYTADELKDASRLLSYLRTTSSPGSFKSLTVLLHQLVANRQMSAAENLLQDVVLKQFPRLIDVMEYDPLAFTEMIAGGDIPNENMSMPNGGSVRRL